MAVGVSDQHMPPSLTFTVTRCVCCSLHHYIAPHVYHANFCWGEPIADGGFQSDNSPKNEKSFLCGRYFEEYC